MHILQERQGPDGVDGTDDDVPFLNPNELSLGQGAATGQVANYVGVQSSVFEVRVEAEIDDYKRTFIGVVNRNGPQTACIKFYWE